MERRAENGEIGTIKAYPASGVSRLTQVDLPRGIRFIAIQERVDILTGDGVEMTPLQYFQEWYAAQTSRKSVRYGRPKQITAGEYLPLFRLGI